MIWLILQHRQITTRQSKNREIELQGLKLMTLKTNMILIFFILYKNISALLEIWKKILFAT